MKRTAEVVIVGGGCMGASVAYHLARIGITDVVLLEREAFLGSGSTGRNAGGVRHQFSTEANVRLSMESIRFFERFSEEVGSPIDFHQDGYLFLLSSEENVSEFRKAVELQRRLGVEVDWLSPDEALPLAPGIDVTGVRAATFCARDGIADPGGVTLGLAGAARAAGAEIRQSSPAVGIRLAGGRVEAVETPGGSIATRVVVNAAGPWANEVGKLAGLELPVWPLRRHIFIASPPGPEGWTRCQPGGLLEALAPAARTMVIDFETTFYFHREGANILFGMGDPAEKPGFDTTVNWEFLPQVVEMAIGRLPVLGESSISNAWAGLYEMTPDAMPLIGAVPEVAGMYVVAGFSGHGFQHSPAAGRIVADLVAGVDPAFDIGAFAPDRFTSARVSREAHVV